VYERTTELLAGMDTPVPLVTVHVHPLSTASVISAIIASQSLGFETVMVPETSQSLSVPESCETFTV